MSFGITELAIILVIVLLLFGTSKLKTLGGDLGAAIKGFRSAVSDEKEPDADLSTTTENETIQDESENPKAEK